MVSSLGPSFNTDPQYSEFENSIQRWLGDPSVGGEKQEAANRIREAYQNQSVELNLSNLDLTTLPDSIGSLTQLEELYLPVNRLTVLPDSIGSLMQLERLFLSYNRLTALPDSISSLTQLNLLDLSHNRLTALPDSIGSLTQLRWLCLNDNQLTVLPDSIGSLTQLESLDLSHNQLTALPDSIEYLTQFEWLDLSHNQLTALANSIGSLTQLKWLSLYNNPEMSQLPIALGECSELTYLSINGTQIPEEQCDQIMALCRTRRDRQTKDQLPARLEMWRTYAKKNAGEKNEFAFILKMDEDRQIIINEWLVRLARAEDFSTNQVKLAKTVCAILATLSKNNEFRDFFLVQAAPNLERCEDRAAMALNEIYTFWKLCTLPEDTPFRDKLELLRGISKTLTLRKSLAKMLKERREDESVEIYLYYESTLRVELGLETAVKSMSHPSIGRRDWIDVENLKEEVNARFIEELTTLPIFVKLLEANETLKTQIDEITEKTSNEMQDALEKSGVTSEEHRVIVSEFTLLKNKRIAELLYSPYRGGQTLNEW